MIQLADNINTVLQAAMMVLIPCFCTSYKNKNNKIKLVFLVAAFWSIITVITHLIGNTSLGVILNHLALIITGIIIFRKEALAATIIITIIYLCIIFNSFIMYNFVWGYIQYKIPNDYLEIANIVLIYGPQYIMGIYLLLKMDIVKKLYIYVKSSKMPLLILIIISVVADFILSFNLIIHDLDNPLFKGIIFILLGIFIILISIYFANVEKKSKEILLLNEELQEKIEELKKVKHDYGAQISYLYGMHLMGKYDRLGQSLKDIINGHNNITAEINITNSDSIISMVVNSMEHKGINIIVDEQASLESSEIAEMELQRVISNILRNSVTAMRGRGVITIRTYYGINNIIIKIQNNGPKIGGQIIDKIFEAGFTTKEDNSKEHGLGLAIVKEIVERHNGKITVSSNELLTEFVMKLPKK